MTAFYLVRFAEGAHVDIKNVKSAEQMKYEEKDMCKEWY